MTRSIHKLLKQIPGSAIRIVMFALLLGFGAGATLVQTRGYVTNANDNTVSDGCGLPPV